MVKRVLNSINGRVSCAGRGLSICRRSSRLESRTRLSEIGHRSEIKEAIENDRAMLIS